MIRYCSPRPRFACSPLVAILLCTLVLLAGCGDEFVGPTAAGVIMPLKVGNQWIGRWTSFDPGAPRYDTLTIVSEVRKGNELWFKGSDGNLYINRADGLWRYSESSESCAEILLAKYPAALNDTFGICTTTKQGGPGTYTYTDAVVTVANDTTITVPAGAYACQAYKPVVAGPGRMGSDEIDRNYYAPNIGPVRKLYYSPIGMWVHVWELVSVTLR